ncbi:helix-turn-helix domain-containing protein [Rhodosalinus sp.]|uniref:helix-turn-helix domain-containing protein n=1 Tax=Rhodosalinus sp. TaxID=2047741 RepID=UPI00397C215A
MPHERYRTVREVADLLQVNEVTVRRWIKGGELRAIDIGKGWRIGPDDLDAFLEDHATRPVATGDGSTNMPPEATGAGRIKGQKN